MRAEKKRILTNLISKWLRDSFTPIERISESQWAERHRRLSPEASARAGKFSFDLAPWQREPMDEVSRGLAGEMVLMWASQVTGKTETVNNIIGHKIDVDPCPILILQPTLEMAETWSKDRLATMLRDTPRLRGKVQEPRSRDSENTILHKKFAGGHITMAGANSPSSLSSRPIRLCVFDEEDRYPASAGTEGDPVALAERRMESFPDAFAVHVSSPTIRAMSRIEAKFEQSDKRLWFCPCPRCEQWQALKWSQVKWEPNHPETAWLECEFCQAHLDESERQRMVRRGEWRATAPFRGVRGYHMNGIYCLFPPRRPFKSRLEYMATDFLRAKHSGRERLKVWTNTFLAETWVEEGEQPDTAPLLARRESYGPELPMGVLVLVGSADVQHDRVEAEIVGFGAMEESWGIRTARFIGNPDQFQVWEQLDAFWSQEFRHPSGHKLKVVCAVVDSGTKPKPVYAFTRPRLNRRVFAVKGSAVPGAPLVSRPQKSSVKSTVLFMVGTDTAKQVIYSRLAVVEPGPGFMHYPMGYGYDQEYFEQLTAERCIIEHKRGFPVRTWNKVRSRNEALDMRAYSLAALEILNPDWGTLTKKLMATSSTVQPEPEPEAYLGLRTAPVVRAERRRWRVKV